MAQFGNFGKLIIFETSDEKVLNFNNFNRNVSANWATHDRIGMKPAVEFLNPNLQSVTFEVVLSAQHGVKPRTMLTQIETAIESGQVELLVIGAAKVGSNYWRITDMSEAWETILNKGELYRAKINLTLEEYV